MPSDNENCKTATFTTILMISMGIFIFSSVKEIESYKLEETKCNITRVAYPKENPYQNKYSWATCKCGKECDSYSPCVKLFYKPGNVTKEYMIRENNRKHDSTCTFHDSPCEADNFDKKMKGASYLNMKYKNKEKKCYYDKDKNKYYLEKDITYLASMIVFGIISGITSIAVIAGCIPYIRERKEEEEENRKELEITNI